MERKVTQLDKTGFGLFVYPLNLHNTFSVFAQKNGQLVLMVTTVNFRILSSDNGRTTALAGAADGVYKADAFCSLPDVDVITAAVFHSVIELRNQLEMAAAIVGFFAFKPIILYIVLTIKIDTEV